MLSTCIRSALLHGSETLAPSASDLQRLCRNDRAMIRWNCGVKPHDEVPMETLFTELEIQKVAVALRTKHLSWLSWCPCIFLDKFDYRYHHPCPRVCGRPRKSWSECVKIDVDVFNLEGITPQNREEYRSGVGRTSQLQLTPGPENYLQSKHQTRVKLVRLRGYPSLFSN